MWTGKNSQGDVKIFTLMSVRGFDNILLMMWFMAA